MRRTNRDPERGFALITVMLLLGLVMTLLAGYFSLTRIELSTTKSSMDSFRGFYASEAGLNVRAAAIRSTFEGYAQPVGTSPISGGGVEPCYGTNLGSGDLACVTYQIQDRDVATFLEQAPGSPAPILIPRGEPFANLNALEYRYTAHSKASQVDGFPEAVLELHFKNRLVPMFQFAVFYNKDLEILPGPAMSLAGPVHTNGDLYVDCKHATLSILGQITTAGGLYQGRKDSNLCQPGDVAVIDPDNLVNLPACEGGQRRLYDPTDVAPWNGQIQLGYDSLTVPPPSALNPTPGELYWDKADLRVLMDLHATPTISVYNADGTIDGPRTAALAGCTGVAVRNTSFYNNREAAAIEMLDVDAQGLLDCAHTAGLLEAGRLLDDATEGGLVFYLGVLGPGQDAVNNYGVRVHNGAELASTAVGAPAIRGLTVVTNQAIYIRGDWNSVNKKPAAFLADSLNVLSNDWQDGWAANPVPTRTATDTTINAAFLAGTDATGGSEGVAGRDLGQYNGGLENYPRLHETWKHRTLTMLGSFVSLYQPLHVDGPIDHGAADGQYIAPTVRAFGYDTDFNDPAKLPPLSPRFVYLRQELFVRQFDL